MDDFYKIAEEIRQERINIDNLKMQGLDYKAKQEFSLFCIWCRALKNADFSEQNFKIYQKEEHTNFDFWLKKRIAELFYGYEFKFDYNTMKWKSYKKSH